MPHLKHLSRTAAVEDIVGEMEENGAVVIDGFLTASALDALNDEIQPHLDQRSPIDPCVNEMVALFHGDKTRHLTGVAGLSDAFVNDVLLHPIYESVGDHFLLQDCASYLLNLGHVLDRGPGSTSQMLHRDHDIWPRKMGRAYAQRMFASLVALSEYTADMGATRVVPGSHNWPIDRQAEESEIVVAEMAPGSAVLYLGSTLHAAGANMTDRRRRGMHISFCLGFLRTEENNLLSTPLERVRKMPRRAQELLGFGVYDGVEFGEGFLGALDNRNPLDLIAAKAL